MVKYKDSDLDAAFSALANPTRRAILSRLAEGDVQVTELAEPLDMSLPAVSKHLKVLEKAQLITRHIEGRVHRFHVNQAPLQQAQSWIERYQQFWTLRLESLGDHLQQTQSKEQ